MRHIEPLRDSWRIKALEPFEFLTRAQFMELSQEDGWIPASVPAEVHEILLQAGGIADPRLTGQAAECAWVTEKDWIYKREFRAAVPAHRVFLRFEGLDTLADVYLNGVLLAEHQDMFLPLSVEISGLLEEVNVLLIHFHSPHAYLNQQTLPQDWEGLIPKSRLLRTGFHGFDDYLGVKPYLTTMGVYGDVLLDYADSMEILDMDVQLAVADQCRKANIGITVQGCGEPGYLHLVLRDPDGGIAAEHTAAVRALDTEAWEHRIQFVLDQPRLWWPRGYGEQALYRVEAVLTDEGGDCRDATGKSIGIRRIECAAPFDYRVNGRPIKLWGANFTPMHGITYRWDHASALRLLDLAENANMNTLRIWGEGAPCPDKWYEETDRRGILLWQDFYTGYGMLPDTEAFAALCRKEVEHLVRRLKHHPSILLWCGGNENFMGRDFVHPGRAYIGETLLKEDFKRICTTLDPGRTYHESSPYGGSYANDPSSGDTHSYTNTWYVPGGDYPVFASENLRVSPPAVKSLLRFVPPDQAWPEGYDGKLRYGDPYPWPAGWTARSSADGWRKIPPIEQFYDADDLPSMIYRFAAAHGLYLRQSVERYRRGRPAANAYGERICQGHLVWKLNSTWPHIYSAVIDYYLEPYIPYYALKRAYEPFLLSFEIGDRLYLWAVNDTPDDREGELVAELFDPGKNRVVKRMKRAVTVRAGESAVAMNLDGFGQFERSHILFAYYVDRGGTILARTNDFVDIERHLTFPEARLGLELQGDGLLITTDSFARCIELKGSSEAHEDDFGWLFEDNYFDLLPGEQKKVRILQSPAEGYISAQAHYSKHAATLRLGGEESCTG